MASTEIGVTTAMTSVERKERRKKKRTMVARRPPTSAFEPTFDIAWRM